MQDTNAVQQPTEAPVSTPAESPVVTEEFKALANTQSKVHLTFQVLGPLLQTMPKEELVNYIQMRPEVGDMNEAATFLHTFSIQLFNMVNLIDEQSKKVAQQQAVDRAMADAAAKAAQDQPADAA